MGIKLNTKDQIRVLRDVAFARRDNPRLRADLEKVDFDFEIECHYLPDQLTDPDRGTYER